MLVVNHPPMREKIKASYTRDELRQLRAFFRTRARSISPQRKPASIPPPRCRPRRRRRRDMATSGCATTSMSLHALALIGRGDLADRVALALAKFYVNHSAKFFDIIDGARSHRVVMDRPHIRFNGAELVESARNTGRMRRTTRSAISCGSIANGRSPAASRPMPR